MQKLYYAKTQMNGGLVSPIIEGRPDFEGTSKSCRQELNMISTVYGSAYNRGGTIYVGTNKNTSEKFILIPFIVGERVAYVLEFGNNYIRVYRYHGQITVTDVAYEIETFYAIEDFFDASGRVLFDYKQSADVLYIVHEKYAPVKLIRYSDTNWQIVPFTFNNGPWQKMNTDENLSFKTSGNTGIVSLSSWYGDNPTATSPAAGPYSGGLSRIGIYFYVGGWNTEGTQLAGRYWDASDVRNLSNAELAAQIINTLPQFVATNPTRSTVEITAIANQAAYSGEKFCIEVIYGTSVTTDSRNNNGTFSSSSASVDVFNESWVGRKIRLWQINTVVEGWRSGWTVALNDICRSGENYYRAASAGTTGPQQPTHIEGTESDGGVAWEYIHSGYGSGTIIEYVSPTEVKLKVDSYIPQGIAAVGTYEWELSLIDSSVNVWPCAIEFFQDRILFGTNLPTGPTLSFSVTGDYENFADIDHGEQLADSAFNLTLFTDLNKINWVCTHKNLYIGTEGSIVMVYALSDNEPFGPNNVTYDELSTVGSCRVKPIKIGGDLLFLGPKGTDIYIVEYDYVTDSYDPKEISILAKTHLEHSIIAWTIQHTPNKMIYAIRDDKKIIGLVYNKEQQVKAFNIIETDGEFETICTIPNAEEYIDEVWVGVKRNINNTNTRYIEYFSNGIPYNIPAGFNSALETSLQYLLDSCIYMDSAKIFSFENDTTEITGLSHLEGKEVIVVADNIDNKYIVNNGAITLSKGAKNVKVGLPYICILEPMPISQDLQNGSGLCRTQRINSIIARLYRTHSFKYGPSLQNLKSAKINTPYDNIDEEVLKSGDIKLDWHGDVTDQEINTNDIVDSTGARMLFVQDRPFPVHFIAFSVAINISEDIR